MGLPFATGYAVDMALLIDAWRAVGAGGLAQVDLVVRQNQHQPLEALGPMAAEVLAAVTSRVERDGRLAPEDGVTPLLERPPMRSVTGRFSDPGHNALTGGRAALHSL
jgi:glucosyl-3-phosphoglycerate synthase